jgi:hypothetical protein
MAGDKPKREGKKAPKLNPKERLEAKRAKKAARK